MAIKIEIGVGSIKTILFGIGNGGEFSMADLMANFFTEVITLPGLKSLLFTGANVDFYTGIGAAANNLAIFDNDSTSGLFATTTMLKTFGGGKHKLIIGGNIENFAAGG